MKKLTITIMIFNLIFLACNKQQKQFSASLDSKSKEYLSNNMINEGDILKQKSYNRVVKGELKRKRLLKFNNFSPFSCTIFNNIAIILETTSLRIHRILLSDTSDHNIIGFGKGRGPGELIQPIDLTCDTENIYILDSGKNTIEIYTIDGSFIRSVKINEGNPYRIIINDSKNEIICRTEGDLVKYFRVYNFNGDLIGKFGVPLINNKLTSILYHESSICKINDNCFLNIPQRLGVIGVYKDKKLVRIRETIDGIKNPDIKTRGSKEIVNFDNLLKTGIKPVCYKNKLLLIRINYSNNNEKKYLIDVYNKYTLEYLFSFKLENHPSVHTTSIYKDQLVICNFQGLHFYNLSEILPKKNY